MRNLADRWLRSVVGRGSGPASDANSSLPLADGRETGEDLNENRFAGRWHTSFGAMTLRQNGLAVSGRYGLTGTECAIDGTVADGKLTFRYEEPKEAGSGWFRLWRYGSFEGEYLADGAAERRPWRGQREFNGLWESSFGPLRLIQDRDHVTGYFDVAGASTIEGHVEGGCLVFQSQQRTLRGRGRLEVDPNHAVIHGEWRQEGDVAATEFWGRRIVPAPDRTWLVVVEAHWQGALRESDFAFGNMLRELFARLPNVSVRQRFFQDEASLLHWCREALYLAESTILVIASHGLPQGLSVNGRTIDAEKIIGGLRGLENLVLLHFSACLVGQDHARVLIKAPFAVSGYTTSINWGESALIEFIYLDMILARGLSPALAAEQLTRLIAFAGGAQVPG